MPTTDPGSDIHFSTDDEFQFTKQNKPISNKSSFGKSKNYVFYQNEIMKRCMDGSMEAIAKIPPELIITSPNRANKQTPSTAPNRLNLNTATNNLLPKFPTDPDTSELNKRTSSWHNLSNTSARIQKPK